METEPANSKPEIKIEADEVGGCSSGSGPVTGAAGTAWAAAVSVGAAKDSAKLDDSILWECGACTYRHEGSEAGFLACAMCGSFRQGTPIQAMSADALSSPPLLGGISLGTPTQAAHPAGGKGNGRGGKSIAKGGQDGKQMSPRPAPGSILSFLQKRPNDAHDESVGKGTTNQIKLPRKS